MGKRKRNWWDEQEIMDESPELTMDEVLRYEVEKMAYDPELIVDEVLRDDVEKMAYEQDLMNDEADEALAYGQSILDAVVHKERRMNDVMMIKEQLDMEEQLMMKEESIEHEQMDHEQSVMDEMTGGYMDYDYVDYEEHEILPHMNEARMIMKAEWWEEELYESRLYEQFEQPVTNGTMNQEWMMNKNSIMNEEWRIIMGEMMKEELVMEEVFRIREEAVAYDYDTGSEELMFDDQSIMDEMMGWHLMRNEESMDYEQSIMDEMMGWNIMTPKTTKQPSTFNYTPLDQPKHEIRVVRLHPRRWLTDSTIVCDIVTVDLRIAPKYEALSYEWGSPSSKEYTIQLNEGSIAVRQNLWWALYDIRDAREPRTFWIDALCINQDDVHERSCQVSRMGDIYSQAATVIAWIGQNDHESRYGRAFLSELTSVSAERYCAPGGACHRGQHRCQWQALSSLCSRSYWSRLWIIQEVLLATDLRIQCGPLSFQWEELSNVFHHLQQNSTGFCSPGLRLSLVSSVPFRLEMRRKKRQTAVLANSNDDLMPLLDLVDLFKDASCFDDRDKIFGLRSLGLSCCKDAVKTDYSMDREEVINTLVAHHEAEHS